MSTKILPPQKYLFFSDGLTWLVLLLAVIACLWRAYHLGAQNLWLDETVHLIQARNFLRTGSLQSGDDHNGVLFTMLLIPVFKLFGFSVENARWLSVAFGLGSLLIIYSIAKRLFFHQVGLIAFALAACSPYLVFWSKIARNYTVFMFFGLLATLQILQLCGIGQGRKTQPGLLPVSFLVITLISGILSHYLLLLYVFGVVLWLSLYYQKRITDYIKSNLKTTGLILATAMVLFVLAFLLLSKNKNLLAWGLPDMRHLKGLYGQAPWYSLSVYSNVLLYDWGYLFLFSIAGLVALIWEKRYAPLYFFLGCFLLPYLLLSFVFREPTAARYLIGVYPYFLILAAFGLYQSVNWIQQRAVSIITIPKSRLTLPASLLLLLPMFPFKNLQSVAGFSYTMDGAPDKKVIECDFSAWRQSCSYLQDHLQQGDVVMATLPQIASVYLDKNDVVLFRQMYFDHKLKKYVAHPVDHSGKNNAQTLSNLIRTVRQNKRGWLLADYYLEGVMTDPQARKFVFQNFHLYPAATGDGSVLLFGWDKDIPAPQNQNMVLQVGRFGLPVSRDFAFQIPDESMRKSFIQMRYRTGFVETNGEATLEINGFSLPLAVSNQSTEIQLLDIPVKAIKRGQNVFRLTYSGDMLHEKFRGYLVYYLEVMP